MGKRLAGLRASLVAGSNQSVVAIVIARDVAGIAAVASISCGSWMIYHPAGFIVAGVLVLIAVVLMAREGS